MSDILEQINSLTEQFSNLFNEDYDTLDNASHIKRAYGTPEYAKDESGKYKRDENGFRVPANKAAKLFQKGHPKDGRTMYGDGYLGQGSGVVWTKRDNNLYDEDDNLKDSNKAVEKSIKRNENKVKKMNDNNSYNDYIKQILTLQEAFSNLFEVEGLGEPAYEVPPSTNKIKKDVKTKDGKVELVSVEDELFPKDGNKREQFRQKVIDTINGMIQGTSTLEDLLQVVRSKQVKAVKEGFEGAIEILEQLLAEANHHANEKNPVVKITDKNYKSVSGKHLGGSFNKNQIGNYLVYNKDTDSSYLVTPDNWKKSKIKKDLEAQGKFYEAVEILEEIINEVSDKTAQGALDKAKERYNRKGYEASMKLFQGDSKGAIEDGNKAQDEYNKHINMQLRRAKRQGKKLVQDKNDHDSFKIEEAQELLEEIINEVSIGKWKEAAASSLPKRKEAFEKTVDNAKKSWDNYAELSKKYPEDEYALYKKAEADTEAQDGAEDKADHAYAVTRLQTHKKANANKVIKAAKKVQDKREDEFGRNPEKRTFLRSGKANQIVTADPVKSRADEAFEGAIEILEDVVSMIRKQPDEKQGALVLEQLLGEFKSSEVVSELFDRPDLLNDIDNALGSPVKKFVKNILAGKKKEKKVKTNK